MPPEIDKVAGAELLSGLVGASGGNRLSGNLGYGTDPDLDAACALHDPLHNALNYNRYPQAADIEEIFKKQLILSTPNRAEASVSGEESAKAQDNDLSALFDGQAKQAGGKLEGR